MSDQQRQQSLGVTGQGVPCQPYQNAPIAQGPQQVQMNGAQMMSAPAHLQPHMMSMMANPGAPMYQPQVMMNNPGTFFVVPDMFAAQMHASRQAQTNGSQQGQVGTYAPGIQNTIGNQAVPNSFHGNNMQRQGVPTAQNQVQQHQMQRTPIVIQAAPPLQQSTQQAQVAPNMMTTQQNIHPVVHAPQATTLNGVPIPSLSQYSSATLQAQLAAAAAACASDPGVTSSPISGAMKDDDQPPREKGELTAAQKAKQNRDRNREHARSTRLRKKAYVQKLKELVEGLHAERTEEVRKRRVAVQHLAEVQGVRRAVARSFLRFHSSYESDPRKWMTLIEDDFWFKQPVTPYRSIRRAEIEQECRMTRGVEALVADAASMSVMVECIGSRSTRWVHIKRDEILQRDDGRSGSSHLPQRIVGQNSRLNHAVSSLSSSSGSSNNSSGEEELRKARKHQSQQLATSGHSQKHQGQVGGVGIPCGAKNISSSSGSSSNCTKNANSSNEYHDYHAQPLPDPMLGDSEESGPADDSAGDSNNSLNGHAKSDNGGKVTSDSSSGDEDKSTDQCASKRRKTDAPHSNGVVNHSSGGDVPTNTCALTCSDGVAVAQAIRSGLPANIAKSGGITHNIRSIAAGPHQGNMNTRLNTAPAISLPPFMGIGKRPVLPNLALSTVIEASTISEVPNTPFTPQNPPQVPMMAPTAVSLSTSQYSHSTVNGGICNGLTNTSVDVSASLVPDADTSSSNSLQQMPQIRAYYHINEDDMLLTDDILMCPFIFRSQGAVICGALAECVMPGMLRAHFSTRNKLVSFEMVYDAMGFMQQLERASGSEGNAQIVPGSLEMALSPNTNEARVITMAKAPFLIVSVNEAWTRATKYTQMEVEGKEMSILHGERTDPNASTRNGKPSHTFDDVAKGRCACSTNVHYDKEGSEYIDFVCSYPLTNAHNEITHILHVSKELPVQTIPSYGFQEFCTHGSDDSPHLLQ